MATKAASAIPEGMHSITAHLWFNGNCKEAISFYEKVFDAKLLAPASMDGSGKKVLHAMMNLGDSQIMMADAWPNSYEQGPKEFSSAGIWFYVEDCDRVFEKAKSAGCEVVMPMMDAFWGDRMGKVKDPFGHCWALASMKWVMSKEEILQGQKEWEQKNS